jgi:hypothetical protein
MEENNLLSNQSIKNNEIIWSLSRAINLSINDKFTPKNMRLLDHYRYSPCFWLFG